MSIDLLDRLEAVKQTAEAQIADAKRAEDIEQLRLDVFSRKGAIQALSKEMGGVAPEDRPKVGAAFNAVKKALEAAFDAARERVESGDGAQDAGLDVTAPGRMPVLGHVHPISRVMDECVDIFRRMGFVVASGPEIEDVYHNFDALNTPKDHPSRDRKDTFYFDDGRLLRTQTSSVQIRVMETQKPPIRIVAPGRTFRRDTPDATHSMNFHQIEGLYVDEHVTMADLKSTLLHFGRELFGEKARIRMRPHYFPFTEPSVEVDFSCVMCGGKGCRICKNSGWIEIAGAGMVDPDVFKIVGIDPAKYTGYAFGFGIERIAMLRYKIHDLRLLYENDVRFLAQF